VSRRRRSIFDIVEEYMERMEETVEEIIKDIIYTIKNFHNEDELSMFKILIGPCSPFSVSEETMKETIKIACEYNVRMHTHLAETIDELEYCKNVYGKNPVELMEEIGFLGENVSFVHSIFFEDRDLKIIKDSKSNIVHCPTSNMRLGSGIARIKEMNDMGIRIGLGVDGSSSNDSSDMLGEVRNCLLLQRVKYGSDALGARDVLRFGTKEGAEILGYKRLGSIGRG
jgi:8-oxoguanine deaminase